MSSDVIVEEARRARDELVQKYGGLDGWIEHLQAMDQQRRGAEQQGVKRASATRGRKSSGLPAKPSRRARKAKS